MRFEKSFIAATEEYSDYNKRVPAPYIRGSFDLKKCPKAFIFKNKLCWSGSGKN